jgi:(p)ppGpp synthase/HD superfamily hydrolase
MAALKTAFQIAASVHGDQLDRGGEPYMAHICRVMSRLQTEEERAVAILHDVLEDAQSEIEITNLRIAIEAFYGWEVLDAVATLTRGHNEPYMEYIRRVKGHPLAVKVKIADLRDNLEPRRLARLPPEVSDRLRDKYIKALLFLANDVSLIPLSGLSRVSLLHARS